MGEKSNVYCVFCNEQIRLQNGEPFLVFKDKPICNKCYIEIIPEIYKMAGAGDGGLIIFILKQLLTTSHLRRKRYSLSSNKELFNKLLHKYKFSCNYCGSKRDLTVDHILPVSKGGTDRLDNLQILCRSCNSKKYNKRI